MVRGILASIIVVCLLWCVLFGCVFAYDSAIVLNVIDTYDKLESILFNVMAIYGLLKSFKDDKT